MRSFSEFEKKAMKIIAQKTKAKRICNGPKNSDSMLRINFVTLQFYERKKKTQFRIQDKSCFGIVEKSANFVGVGSQV
jgi:hypothetical protein